MDDRKYRVNSGKVFYNFGGKMPPVTTEAEPAPIPPDSPVTQPKLITDTTLRDGAQDPGIALFPLQARLAYFDLLHALDNGTGVLEAIDVFVYQKRDLWVLEKLLERGYPFPKVFTWARAIPKDVQMLAQVAKGRVQETMMLASSSDHQIFDKLHFRSKEEAAETYLSAIVATCEMGIRPRIQLEDTTRADIYGWVIPFIQRVNEETRGFAKFCICDTIGLGVPDPQAALPFGIPRLVATVLRETGVELEFHGHNDFGLATANTLAAWTYGCKRVNVAFAALGERTGNTPLEEVLANYIRIYGDPGFNLEALTEMAQLIHRQVLPVPAKRPIIGQDIFTTQAGLHQSGVNSHNRAEGGLIYLPYDPALLGRTRVELNRIGSLSGLDGIVSILNQAVKEATGKEGKYSRSSKVVRYIYQRVQAAYEGTYDPATGAYVGNRSTFFQPHELLALAREYEAQQSEEPKGLQEPV